MQLVVLTQKEKYSWIHEMFEMNGIMVKKTQNKQQVEQPFLKHWKKHYPTFEFLYLHLYYLWYIFVQYNVIMMLPIYLFLSHMMYNMMQLLMALILNWIFIFANHKWATRVLNALVFLFLRVFYFKCATLLIYFSNSIYMYFHQGSKTLEI
jgi:hypothetical protein